MNTTRGFILLIAAIALGFAACNYTDGECWYYGEVYAVRMQVQAQVEALPSRPDPPELVGTVRGHPKDRKTAQIRLPYAISCRTASP
jgi:hypothetical protein